MSSLIRLYINHLLEIKQEFELPEASSHYLTNVMKQKEKDIFLGFDGQSGEYELEIIKQSKKHLQVRVLQKTREYKSSPDIWLLFAPVKKDQTDFIIQKAVELGVSKIIPVITRYTISGKTKTERFVAQSIEAAEQCRRLDIPEISSSKTFNEILSTWDESRRLYYMDETQRGLAVGKAFAQAPSPIALLVGPEGGFSPEERSALRGLKFSQGVTLGPRILRAETAVVSALSCWQALSGDWVNYGEQE